LGFPWTQANNDGIGSVQRPSPGTAYLQMPTFLARTLRGLTLINALDPHTPSSIERGKVSLGALRELRMLIADNGRRVFFSRQAAVCGKSTDKSGYQLEFEDNFDGERLDEHRWIAHYLAHWSTRQRAAARYEIGNNCLSLLIEADQLPWCPELDGLIRVSSLQTGLFSGPVGSKAGQLRFNPNAVVREGPLNIRLYTPLYGLFEIRAKAIADPRNMIAFWMIGYEDEPYRSAEICICEIFGREMESDHTTVGLGIHPFGDPNIVDDFSKIRLPIDAREFHLYQADWTPEHVSFAIEGELVKTVRQSPSYPMQFMLGLYEFPDSSSPDATLDAYPKRFIVDYVRGYRRVP
jgi:hypothetical protein